MSVSTTLVPNEPIMIIEYTEPLDATTDVAQSAKAIMTAARDAKTPLYIVTDISTISFSFSDIMLGLGAATRGENSVKTGDAKLHFVIVTKGSGMIDLGIKAMSQVQYGGLDVKQAATIDEGLAIVRDRIRQEVN